MSELYMVRHAQASFGALNYDKLSELGHQQSRWLGEYLALNQVHFDHVMLGDLVRHRETLDGLRLGINGSIENQVLNEAIDQASVMPHLNEFDFKAVAGAYILKNPDQAPPENATKSDFYRVFKKAVLAWSKGELDQDVPERWEEFHQRVAGFQELLRTEFVGKKILAVTSGGAIGMAVSQMLHTSDASMIELNLQIRNTSLTHCFFNHKKVRLHTFNHVPHLESMDRKQNITYS